MWAVRFAVSEGTRKFSTGSRPFLRQKQDWFSKFKEFRDPVAHRVPLYAIPGVIREGSEAADQLARLQAQMDQALAAENIEAYAAKFIESTTVGEYEPYFMQYGKHSAAVRDIRWQIAHDQGHLLETAEAVVPLLFK
jgi:hypothetical protein